MKFSCPKCQAKYQIADEKVIGKTLKMKCRKCGTYIPIQGKAATIDARVSNAREVAPRSGKAPTPAKGTPAAPRGAAQTRAPRPGAAAAPRAGGAGREAPAPPGATTSRAPSPGSKPRSSAASTDRLQLSIPAAQHAPPPPSVRYYSSGREAGLPSMPVQAKQQPPPEPVWYVGIGGHIVGPMTKDKLETRVAAGEVNEESYVWKDGQGGWKQIPEVPEVVDVLQSAPAPPSMPMQAKQAFNGAAAPAAAGLQTGAPDAASAGTPGAAGAAAQQQSAAAAEAQQQARAPMQAAQPLHPQPSPQVTAPTGEQAPTFGTPGTQGLDFDESEPFVVPRRSRSMGTGAIAFAVIVAIGLGVSIGFVVFGGSGQKVIREVIEVPVATKGESVPAPPTASDGEKQASGEEEEAQEGDEAGEKRVAGGSRPRPTTTATKSKDSGDEKELSGLQGLSGLKAGGPTGPSDSASEGGGGQELSSSQIQRTVAKYRASVKRGCWQPALDSRARDAPSSARVTVAINVTPSGAVRSAKAGGTPKGYPGLANCITRKVRLWRFPASSGSTQVNVPFVFAAQ